jgi:GT2 family glycosyltransferase
MRPPPASGREAVPTAGLATPAAGLAAPAADLSVVVSTCAMGDRAARCVASILACERQPLEVIVVENRPAAIVDGLPAASHTAQTLRRRFPGEKRVRCVAEPRRGLSRARNAGLACARGEIVAFTDDDILVEPGWIGAILDGLGEDPRTVCLTGPILPQALHSEQQRIFDRFARFDKGASRRLYALDRPPPGDILFPYAAGRFGSGADIALRTGFARSIGGFDPRLGAGTSACGGEDLDLFIRVLRAGASILYEPRAAVRHEHVDSPAALRRHALHYGIGLSAAITKQLLDRAQRRELLRKIPAGLAYLLDPRSDKNAGKGSGYPRSLDALELLGVALGPLAYLASSLAARRRPPVACRARPAARRARPVARRARSAARRRELLP